jgi:hypothetical protein
MSREIRSQRNNSIPATRLARRAQARSGTKCQVACDEKWHPAPGMTRSVGASPVASQRTSTVRQPAPSRRNTSPDTP